MTQSAFLRLAKVTAEVAFSREVSLGNITSQSHPDHCVESEEAFFWRVRKRTFPKGWFWRMLPGPQKLERGYKKRNDGTKNRNEGTKNGTTVPKTGTRVHSPKPPFTKPPLCFLLIFCCFERTCFKKKQLTCLMCLTFHHYLRHASPMCLAIHQQEAILAPHS